MKKSKSNVTYTDNSITVQFGKSVINFEVSKGKVLRTKNLDKNITKKEDDSVSYFSKFVSDWLPVMKGSWKNRIEKMAFTIAEILDSVQTFRTLNNNLRKHFDDGSDEFWASHFYEGVRKGNGVRSKIGIAA